MVCYMKVISPKIQFFEPLDGPAMLKRLERAGRVCYKSENKITVGSAEQFLGSIIRRGHESVLEHEKITVSIICDRGVTHELVRHRIASYSQESTRYCNYAQEKFGRELTFIRPCFWQEEPEKYQIWQETMAEIERNYFRLLDLGAAPQEARSILPNSLKTELAVTMNLREWRHFFRLRTDAASHPQMRETACALLEDFRARVPILFDTL